MCIKGLFSFRLTMEGDLEKATLLLKDIRDKCKDTTNHVNELCKKAEKGKFTTSKVLVVPLYQTNSF